MKRINGTLGVYFTLEAAAVLYVQDTILNLLNSYLRSNGRQNAILNLPTPYIGLCGSRCINGKMFCGECWKLGKSVRGEYLRSETLRHNLSSCN